MSAETNYDTWGVDTPAWGPPADPQQGPRMGTPDLREAPPMPVNTTPVANRLPSNPNPSNSNLGASGPSVNVPRQKGRAEIAKMQCRRSGMACCKLILLFVVVLLYTLMGGVVFREIEHDNWEESRSETEKQFKAINLTEAQIAQLSELSYGPASEDDNPWDLMGASFFCLTVITTIGYGSYAPVTTGGRVFTVFYGLFGIAVVGLAYAQAATLLVGAIRMVINGCRGKVQKEVPIEERQKALLTFEEADLDGNDTVDTKELKLMLARIGPKEVVTDQDVAEVMKHADLSSDQAIGKREFGLAVAVWWHINHTDNPPPLLEVLIAACLIVIFIFAGPIPVMQFEDWKYWESVWFAIITLTTIGFGDFAPLSDKGQAYATVFVFLGLGTVAYFLGAIVSLASPLISDFSSSLSIFDEPEADDDEYNPNNGGTSPGSPVRPAQPKLQPGVYPPQGLPFSRPGESLSPIHKSRGQNVVKFDDYQPPPPYSGSPGPSYDRPEPPSRHPTPVFDSLGQPGIEPISSPPPSFDPRRVDPYTVQ